MRIFIQTNPHWKRCHSLLRPDIPSPGLKATLSPSDGERDGVRGSPSHAWHSQSQCGLSLIECLAYIAVLAVLMAIGGSTVAKAWDRSRALSRNSQDIQRAIAVGERWRTDIRAATGRIETIASPAGQTLRIPGRNEPVEYKFEEGELRRRSGAHGGWITVLQKVNTSQMQPGTEPGVAAWQWELELQPAQKNAHVRPLFTFTAVAGKEIAR